jgi:hypothetical protein
MANSDSTSFQQFHENNTNILLHNNSLSYLFLLVVLYFQNIFIKTELSK